MFFEDREKTIYRPGWSETGVDPLRLRNLLIACTGGRFYTLLADRNAPTQNDGDVSPQGKAEKERLAALAEIELAVAWRKSTESPNLLDGEALERLYGFMEYLEGKDSSAGKPSE